MDNLFSVPEASNAVVQALINLLAALIVAVAPIIIARVTVWGKKAWADFKASQPEHVQRLIEGAALFGATFAEKAGPALKDMGVEKLDAALDAANRWLEAQGFEVDDTLLRQAIEVILFQNPEQFPSTKG